MARLIRAGEFIGRGEERVALYLEQNLPESWVVISNKELVAPDGSVREIDFIVIGDHSIFSIEEKSWSGNIHGNENGWVLRTGESYSSPLSSAGFAARRLAGLLRGQVPGLRDTVKKQHFVFERVLLSSGDVKLLVHDQRCNEMVLMLKGADEDLRRFDRLQQGPASIGQFRKSILEVLTRLPDRPQIPTRIRDYEILESLPSAGNIRIFRARHPDSTERVLKLLERPSSADVEQRRAQETALLREYDALRRLAESSRVPRVDPYFSWEGDRYWVVPLCPVSGRSLRSDRVNTAPPSNKVLPVVEDALQALIDIHRAGIVHRALNPDRVYLHDERYVMFSDFIIARIQGARTIASDAGELEPGDAYRAPECRVDLGLAEPASDVFSLAASLLFWICGHEPSDDGSPFPVLREVRTDLDENVADLLDNIFDRCLIEDERARPGAGELLRQIREAERKIELETTGHAQARRARPEPGTILADQYRIIRVLGEGGTAITYLAEDTVGDGFFVLKTIRNPELISRLARVEFRSLLDLNHPNLPRIYDIRPPASPFHLKLEYVRGSSIREVRNQLCGNRKKILWIAEQVLEALSYLEARGFLHRDISPSNILVPDEEAGPVKLIDFGLATQQTGTISGVGTPRYRPPEIDQGGQWNRTCDLYSLGVVIFELITGRLPYEIRDEVPKKTQLVRPTDEEAARFGSPLLGVLLKAVAPIPAERFQSAKEFAEAVRTGAAVTIEARPPGEEVINSFVDSLRGAYRNSRIGNPDNRGLDTEFAKQTYVPTRLDTNLVPQLLEGRFHLVILSGNPGDGKTAFLQRFLDVLRQQGAISQREDPSGWQYGFKERMYTALYDASESHEEKTADEMIREILRPLEGPAPPDARHTVLIAVNDGRLLDYFERYGALRYPWVWEQIRRQFEGEQANPSVLLVDLKRRCLVSLVPGRHFLFSRIIEEFLTNDHWAPCERCIARNECPIKFNADSLRDEALGPMIRRGLHSLLLAIHLRREHRPTIRDLRSALAYLITHDFGCDEIHHERRSGKSPIADPTRLYFQAAFNGKGRPDLLLDEWTSLDPADTPSPRLDRFLHFHRTSEQADHVSRTFVTPLRRQNPKLLMDPEWLSDEWGKTIKRRYFFEADESAEMTRRWELPCPENLLPHRHMQKFAKILNERAFLSDLRDLVARGISRADGVPALVSTVALGLRLTESADQELTVVKLFPVEEFQCRSTRMTGEFTEEIPDQFIFEHVSGSPSLVIGLNLFELLCRMEEGYLPGSEEQASLIQDINEFKNQLLARPSREVALIESGQRIHRIEASGGIIRRLEVTS